MKKNKLILATFFALLSLISMPISTALTDSRQPSPDIIVAANETLTITLAGRMIYHTYTGFVTNVSNPSKQFFTDTGSYYEVVDYTVEPGHDVEFSWDDNTWTYMGSDIGKNDCTNYGSALPPDDSIGFSLTSSNGQKYWTAKDTDLCTGSTSTMTITGQWITSTDKLIGSNTTHCPGTSRYQPGTINLWGPRNGFGSGYYEQTGTFTVTDGTGV